MKNAYTKSFSFSTYLMNDVADLILALIHSWKVPYSKKKYSALMKTVQPVSLREIFVATLV